MRRAFTLIELLVIVGIMGAMVTVSVVSVRAGQGAARVRGATRDLYALVRHARSTALVTQQPAVITYSTVEEDGEVMAKIEVATSKVLDTTSTKASVQTLKGEELEDGMRSSSRRRRTEEESTSTVIGDSKGEEGKGQSVEDILFAPVSEDVLKGMRLKVLMGDDELSDLSDEQRKSKISVFSTTDHILSRYRDARASAKAEKDAKESDSASSKKGTSRDPLQEEVSIIWEVNGRVEPHKVWIYPDGAKPEDGLCIKVDRFGAAKVLSKDDRDDD